MFEAIPCSRKQLVTSVQCSKPGSQLETDVHQFSQNNTSSCDMCQNTAASAKAELAPHIGLKPGMEEHGFVTGA